MKNLSLSDDMDEIIEKVRDRVKEGLNTYDSVDDEMIMELIENQVIEEGKYSYISLNQRDLIVKKLFNSIRKLDVLQEILEDSAVDEIMINNANRIFVEKRGVIERYPAAFSSEDKLLDVINQIVSKVNRIVNESNPIVDVRLQDGSRVNVVLPPIALDGPTVTIRKFPEERINMEKLIHIGSISEEGALFLRKLVRAGYNIFISGGTGSGKTTFLNALSNFIPRDERIITIEDSAELQISSIDNLVRLESRNANIEGRNEITIRDLVKSALRMRPDRIIIGEIRDAAVIDLVNAMNTGHDGSISTGHANSPIDMLHRMETLYLTGMDVPLMAIRSQIASAVDIVVQLGRLRDKTRKVLEISEIVGIKEGEYLLNTLFKFEDEGNDEDGKVKGCFKRTENELQNRAKLLGSWENFS